MVKHYSNLPARDLRHIWHPCAQMKDYASFPPLPVVGAQGAHIHLADGRRLIDSGASWWCKSLGHQHPALMTALRKQSEQLEHVILANTTHEAVVQLSEKLASLTPGLNKVMYASDGSCAIEIALKMSLHARIITGSPRRGLAALQGAYHGETALTLSVSDLGIYKSPYQAWLQPCHFLGPLPAVTGPEDPRWHDASSHWPTIEKQLAPLAKTLTALVVEPVVQGAGGMRVYSPDLLKRLRAWCTQHEVHLIADEIMTGFGRTGTMLAMSHANISSAPIADFVCLGKGLTGGTLPLSAVLIDEAMYRLFYDDYGMGKDFLHSHTHTGNALACAVAVAAFDTMATAQTLTQVQHLASKLKQGMLVVAQETGALHRLRGVGGVVAADLKDTKTPRLGYRIYQEAVKRGALLRPLGNTLYWCPPLHTDDKTLAQLIEITQSAIAACCTANARV